jgi:hypothetical protein
VKLAENLPLGLVRNELTGAPPKLMLPSTLPGKLEPLTDTEAPGGPAVGDSEIAAA